MTHDQIPIARVLEPLLQQHPINRLSALEVIHTKKPSVQRQTTALCRSRKMTRPQRLYGPGFKLHRQRHARHGGRLRAPQPRWCFGVASLHLVQQGAAYLRELMNMLMPVYGVGGAPKQRLEGVQL